jgi:phage FluMu protein Com
MDTHRATRCKYCGKHLTGPCSAAHIANICENAPLDVNYVDRPEERQTARDALKGE